MQNTGVGKSSSSSADRGEQHLWAPLGKLLKGTLPWLPTLTDNPFFPSYFVAEESSASFLFFLSFMRECQQWFLLASSPPPVVSAFTNPFKISCGPEAVLPLLSGSWPAADTLGMSCQNPCHNPRGLSGKGPCCGKVQKQETTWEEPETTGEERRFIGEEVSGTTRVCFMTAKSILWYTFFCPFWTIVVRIPLLAVMLLLDNKASQTGLEPMQRNTKIPIIFVSASQGIAKLHY